MTGAIGVVLNLVAVGVFIYVISALNTIAENRGLPGFLRKAINPDRAGGRDVDMICADCGAVCAVPAWDVMQHFVRGAGGVLRAMRNPDTLRADMEMAHHEGMVCPECGETSLYTTIRCEHCGEPFLDPWRSGKGALDVSVTCPHCGKVQERIGPYGIDQEALKGLVEDIKGKLPKGYRDLLEEAASRKPRPGPQESE